MHRPWPRAAKYRKGTRQHLRQLIRAHQRVAERGQAGHQVPLRRQFVQPPFAEAELVGAVDAGDHQHRDRITICLAQRGGDIGQPRSGYDETGGWPAAGAGETVRHETGTLLMPRRDMADLGVSKAPVQFDRMDAGNSEDGIDPVLLQDSDQRLATGRHLARLRSDQSGLVQARYSTPGSTHRISKSRLAAVSAVLPVGS